MSQTFTEPARAGAFILSEANGTLSREKIVVAAGAALVAGQVLGVVTATSKYAPYNNAANDGTEAAVGILYGPLEASDSDRSAVAIVRQAEVDDAKLTGLDAAARVDFASRNIICR